MNLNTIKHSSLLQKKNKIYIYQWQSTNGVPTRWPLKQHIGGILAPGKNSKKKRKQFTYAGARYNPVTLPVSRIFCSSGRRIFLFLLMRVVATFLWVTRCRKTRHGNWSRFSFLPYRGRLVLNQRKTSWLLIISTSSSSSSPITKWSHSTNENQRQREQMAHRKSWTIRTSANEWGGNQMGNRRENTVWNVSKIKFLTKLSLMSRVLRLGRAWSSDSVIVEAQWSSRLCSGWDSTETPICAMIRLAITSRPLKLLGRFILFFFFFPFVWEKTTFNVLWVYPSFPLFGRETITFEISPSGENTSGTDALKLTEKTSNAADVSKAWMCKRKKSWSKKTTENNEISTTNDRLKSWWNPSGIIQPLPPLFLSTKACEEMPIKPKNLIIVKELRKMGNLLVFRLRDRLRIRSTWIHINIHIERERETHTITHEEKKSRISSSKNSSTAQCVCVFRLIVIVCCWRTSRCQATQRRATATLLLPSALAIQLGRAGRTEPNNIPPSCKPRVNPSPHPDVVLINKYKKKTPKLLKLRESRGYSITSLSR